MAEALTPRDPRKLGRWKIISRLGFGGMGVVYLGTDGRDQAAVKVIRPGLLDDPQMVERFIREVGVLQAVRDVHISQFLDANLQSEPAWLAIEYISGPTVKQHVEAQGPLPAAEWWSLAQGIAQALAVLEVHRVTHRDIKPGNVILSGERGERPVLIDFGIAHPEDATSLTATGLVTGSPAWLSPEQATSDVTGAPSDVFSLGSLLAYAGTGRAPFGEGVAVAVLMRITSSEPSLEGLDPAQAELVTAMLAKDPAARPNARQVLARARAGAVAAAQQQAEQPRQPEASATRVMPSDPGVSADLAQLAASVTAAKAAAAAAPADAGDATSADVAAKPAEAAGSAPAQAGSDPSAPPAPAVDATAPDLPRTAPVAPGAPGAVGGGAPRDPAAMVTPEMLAPTSRIPPYQQGPVAGAAPLYGAVPAPPGVAPQVAPPISPPVAVEPSRRRRRLPALLGIIGLLAVAVIVWLVLSGRDSGDPGGGDSTPSASGSPSSSPSTSPTSNGTAPPAPASDQLRSGDWLLSSYSIKNDATSLWIEGKVANRGTAAGSANLVVWLYVNGASIGSVSAAVTDVPAGQTVAVTMRGDAKWQPGQKVLLLQAEPS